MSDKYVLDANGEPQPCYDLLAWARAFQRQNYVVARTQVGESEVSTIFLGLDYRLLLDRHFDCESPLLWETQVIGGAMDQKQDRCSGKRADAQRMHLEMVERVAKAISVHKTDKYGRKLCTKDNPMPKDAPGQWTHESAHEIGEQEDGWPSGDVITYKCEACGTQWKQELPQ